MSFAPAIHAFLDQALAGSANPFSDLSPDEATQALACLCLEITQRDPLRLRTERLVRYLLNQGARADRIEHEFELLYREAGITPTIALAAHWGKDARSLVEMLVEKGAILHNPFETKPSLSSVACALSHQSDPVDWVWPLHILHQRPPGLHDASLLFKDNPQWVKPWVELIPNNWPQEALNTCLRLAILKSRMDVLPTLVEKGAQVDYVFPWRDRDADWALRDALAASDLPTLRWVLERIHGLPWPPALDPRFEMSPGLVVAAEGAGEHVQRLELLREKGLLDLSEEGLKEAMFAASAQASRWELCHWLLDEGLSPTTLALPRFVSPLLAVCSVYAPDVPLVQRLVEGGADPFQKHEAHLPGNATAEPCSAWDLWENSPPNKTFDEIAPQLKAIFAQFCAKTLDETTQTAHAKFPLRRM